MTTPRENPTTCREAAQRLRERSNTTPYEQDMHRLVAAAEVLECFGEMPPPAGLTELYAWDQF